MSIYTTVATANPAYAKGIIAKYGYKAQGVRTTNDLAKMLEQLVGSEGEPALRDIADAHPDKGLFLEIYGQPQVDINKYLNASGSDHCTCHHCRNHRDRDREYHNFSGAEAAPMVMQAASQGSALMAAALILAVAILVKR
jgi:hypothetical protein